MQPFGLQEWIHKFEEGEGTRYIRLALFLLALLGLTALWHIREAKNFAAPEAMDAAQVARNISRGKGFSTLNIRPLSVALIEEHAGKESPSAVSDPHPDLANPPIYPLVLAGLMKVLPFQWEITTKTFWRYQPEQIIGALNQALFFLALYLVYKISLRLFDKPVAFLATILMALTETYWEFTTSGLSTMLLIVLFLILCWVLILFESGAREATRSKGALIGLAASAGIIIGIMALTRYSMIWLAAPVAIYLVGVGTGVRSSAAPVAVAAALLLVAPWAARNFKISGTLFGTAGFAVHEETTVFPGHTLQRALPTSVSLELNKVDLREYTRKLFLNSRTILTADLPQAAGSWIWALFLGALLMPFRSPALSRLKYLMAGTLLTYLAVQALGRTELSAESPRLNSENLLVIFSPIFFVLGAAFFYVLLDQVELPMVWLRGLLVAAFVVVLSLPLGFRLLPPRSFPVNYPPYSPPTIQIVTHWLKPDELLMTDMPWATAWYGERSSIWTTLDTGGRSGDDFYRINDYHRPVKGIYLTPITTDAKFLSVMRQSREGVWGKFYLDVAVLKNLPTGFPLQIVPVGLLPDQLFISDRVRWHQ